MSQIKVLQVVPPLNRAGAQMHVLQLCRYLNPSMFSIQVCELIDGHQERGLLKAFQEQEIPICTFPYLHWRDLVKLPSLLSLYHYFRQVCPDILHIHDLPVQGFVLTILAKLAGVHHVIITLHGLWRFYGWRKPLLRLLFSFQQHLVSFIAVSQATKDFWTREWGLPPEKIEVIWNGIELERFTDVRRSNALRKALGLDESIPIIGTVGSLTPKKGHRFLIQAVPMVLAHCPETHFVFVGEGELRESLYSLSHRLGVEQYVHFLGQREDVPSLLSQFDIFVFPSAFEAGQRIGETFGIALVEAMAAGLPVVATRFSGIPEVVEDGVTGLLVPPGDSQSLANAIVTLLKDRTKARRMGLAGRKRAEQLFSVDRMVRRVEQYYLQFGVKGTR